MLKNTGKLAGRTIFITGASRGIGKAIALKAAKDGANIVIAAKTAELHPKLPGTIYTTAEEVVKAGGQALPCIVDIRNEEQVRKAVNDAVSKFGGIDILVNNASAISLTGTLETDMKRYDLMHNINTRGTFLVSKECIPHLLKSNHAHILNISPPLNLNPMWFSNHVAYTMAKYGMSMCVLGMSKEFEDKNIAVNALWPRTAIHTAAIEMLSGPDSSKVSRKPDIMSDAAYAILSKEPQSCTGKFLIDDEVLSEAGIEDLKSYACDPENADNLMDDFFLEPKQKQNQEVPDKPDLPVDKIFNKIKCYLNEDLVSKTKAVYQFNIDGAQKVTWFIDLKYGSGKCGVGEPTSKPDATLMINNKNFVDMFTGKLKPIPAYISGKLKISGDMQKVMKLEKLMNNLKAKL